MREQNKIVLGTRGSQLARAQAQLVEQAIQSVHPDAKIDIQIIATSGDEKSKQQSFDPRAGRKGIFTAEIERTLRAGDVDVAVHSAKDLPSDLSEGLVIAAALPRAAVEDVLISKSDGGIMALGQNATVATGSVRRQHQLRGKRPDVQIVDLRGNVPTRLRKLAQNDWDAIILARAGLDRLGYDLSRSVFEFEGASFHVEFLSREEFLPAGGQGIIALQIRDDDKRAQAIVDPANDHETLLCLRAEREFLRLLQADCETPVGVLAVIEGNRMKMRSQVFDLEATAPRESSVEGTSEDGEQLAAQLFKKIHGE